MDIRPISVGSVDDLGALLCTERQSAGCWCMWFITPVKDFHAAGAAGNQERFLRLAASEAQPLGLIGYQDGQPVGWCATGPRSRYERAIRTPSYKGRDFGRDLAEDDRVWLIPCLFVRREARGSGLSTELIRSATSLAKNRGAVAVEAFPFSGEKRRRADTQVGFEACYVKCGFKVVRRTSSSRCVVRLDLAT